MAQAMCQVSEKRQTLLASFILQLRQNIEINFDFSLPHGCLVGSVVHISRLKNGTNGSSRLARHIKPYSGGTESNLEKLDAKTSQSSRYYFRLEEGSMPGRSPRSVISALIDPVQKFDEPLAIDPKKDFVVLRVVRREWTITAVKRYPNFTVNQFRTHTITTGH
jgi:hypothetical protein